MKYFSLILSFIIIVSIKSSSDNVINIKLGEEETITVRSDVYYIVTNLDNKDGFLWINVRAPKPKTSSIQLSYRLASDTKDIDKGEFKNNYISSTSEKNGKMDYNINYEISSNDKVNILKIVGLEKNEPVTISVTFASDKKIIIILAVIGVVLLIIIGVIICICKGLCKCCCC